MQGEETNRAQFIDRVTDAIGMEEYPKLVNAYQLYKALHRGQMRKGGERYVTHPRAVAEICLEFGPSSAEEIIIALLHDSVEDAFILPVFLCHAFGAGVSTAVAQLSKYDLSLGLHGAIIKKKLSAVAYYQRIRFSPLPPVPRVKCGDRIHNLRTMGPMGVSHQRRKVAETREYILPIAIAVDQRMAAELERLCADYEKSWG